MAQPLNLPIQDIIRLYDIDHLSSYEIADRFHTSVPTILKKLRQNGVRIRDCNKNESRKNHVTSETLNPNIKSIVIIDGLRYGELICPNCGAKRTVPVRSSNTKTATLCHNCYLESIKPPTIEQIKILYIDQCLTIKAIAKRLHTSHNYISQMLKDNGVPIRASKARRYNDSGATCGKCRQFKPLTDFYKQKNGRPFWLCISCQKEKNAEYRKGKLPLTETNEYRAFLSRKANARNYEIKVEVLSHYSNSTKPICANPFRLHNENVIDIDVLTIDHVNGDGWKDRDKIHGSSGLYRKLKRESYPSGYQVLCANCQMKKSKLNNEHPRKYHHDGTMPTHIE